MPDTTTDAWSLLREHVDAFVLDESPEMTLLVNLTQGKVVDARGPVEQILGRPREDWRDLPLEALVPQDESIQEMAF